MGKKSQFTEEQIIRALKEVDAGARATDVCRRIGVTEQTFYRWKAKFGGMEVSDARRLRQLEEENRRLKQMVADQALDLQAVKAVLRKNGEAGGIPPGCRLRQGGVQAQYPAGLPSSRLRAIELALPWAAAR